jgi:uncharacterized protein (DUF3820 family)
MEPTEKPTESGAPEQSQKSNVQLAKEAIGLFADGSKTPLAEIAKETWNKLDALEHPPKPKKSKQKSRPERWAEAAANAGQALSDLQELQEEYQNWFDNMSENLQSGATGDLLQAICDLDISGALDTANEAENIDLPRGFGRD